MSPPQAGPFILDLDSPHATLEQVGGKGASLARLAAAGLPVPAGFHITTAAYRRHVDENHLRDSILSAVAQAGAPAALDRASVQIQSLIGNGTIPTDIAAMIRQRYEDLGPDAAAAVRSSGTAEDLPGMSFAGQLETYLNVRGGDEVIDAVKRCWASLWTARAIAYRQRQGIRPEDIGIAVVVQRLVPAQVAGVVFTVNPVSRPLLVLILFAKCPCAGRVGHGREAVMDRCLSSCHTSSASRGPAGRAAKHARFGRERW